MLVLLLRVLPFVCKLGVFDQYDAGEPADACGENDELVVFAAFEEFPIIIPPLLLKLFVDFWLAKDEEEGNKDNWINLMSISSYQAKI